MLARIPLQDSFFGSWVGPEGSAKPSYSPLCLGKVESGLTSLLHVSNSPQSLSFAGDERI